MSFTFPEIVVTQASAGSGKTYALAKRFVQLLLAQEGDLSQVLAITFTNKASQEMKARIFLFLKKIAFKDLTEDEINQFLIPIDLSMEDASIRSFKLLDQIIHQYHFFQVQTIDSFVNGILSSCAFYLDIPGQAKISRGSKPYVQEALDRLIDSAATDKNVARIFNKYIHQYLFIENRSSWFPKKELFTLVMRLYYQHNTFGKSFITTEVDDIGEQKVVLGRMIEKLQRQLPQNTHATFRKAIEKFVARESDGFDVDSISDYFARDAFPSTKGPEVDSDVIDSWEAIGRGLKHLCESEAFAMFNPYVDIYKALHQEFLALARKDGIIFLEELNAQVSELFNQGKLSLDELYYRLATRFTHYLLDEFQDTNRLQWSNLKPMISEALSSAGSLFYVGDPKQAIYSFRGGDVSLFHELAQSTDLSSVRRESLVCNFRSHPVIVDFNNTIFSEEYLSDFIHSIEAKKKDIDIGSVGKEKIINNFSEAIQESRSDLTGGYVEIHHVQGKVKSERDEKIVEYVIDTLEDVVERFDLGSIAILTRNNTEVSLITQWLLEAGYPVNSERTADIKGNVIIEELITFLRCLQDPYDDVSLAYWLTGNIYATLSGRSVEEMHTKLFEWRRIRHENKMSMLQVLQQEDTELFEKIFKPLYDRVGLFPLYELLTTIVNRFDIVNNFNEDHAFIMHLCELVKAREDEYSDLSSFLEFYDELEGEDLYVQGAQKNAIRVMTIHKAKGLEFPVVLLPFLGMNVQVGSSGDGHGAFTLMPADEGMHLIRLKKKYYKFSDRIKLIHDAQYQQELLNELNNVYVALTRASCEMYVVIPDKVGTGSNLLELLIPQDVASYGAKVTLPQITPEEENVMTIPAGASHEWISFLQNEFQDRSYTVNHQAAERGDILHAILERITVIPTEAEESQKGSLDCARDDIKSVIDKQLKDAVMSVAQEYDHIDAWDEFTSIISKALHHPDWQPYFIDVTDQIFCEYTCVNKFGDTLRMDRVLMSDDRVTIIDFKSSHEGAADHIEQVNRYIEAMTQMHPNKEVIGYLAYLDDLEINEIGKTLDTRL